MKKETKQNQFINHGTDEQMVLFWFDFIKARFYFIVEILFEGNIWIYQINCWYCCYMDFYCSHHRILKIDFLLETKLDAIMYTQAMQSQQSYKCLVKG